MCALWFGFNWKNLSITSIHCNLWWENAHINYFDCQPEAFRKNFGQTPTKHILHFLAQVAMLACDEQVCLLLFGWHELTRRWIIHNPPTWHAAIGCPGQRCSSGPKSGQAIPHGISQANQMVTFIKGPVPKLRPIVGQQCVCLEPVASFSLIPCSTCIFFLNHH